MPDLALIINIFMLREISNPLYMKKGLPLLIYILFCLMKKNYNKLHIKLLFQDPVLILFTSALNSMQRIPPN